MSLRYTGEATMDEPALRDVERWKDKIEVRLDNRQVFFLFFGSAMVACMLFVLGVIVGKRLESRGRAEAPAIEDPLAVLDRFGATAVPAAPAPAAAALTFPRALIGGGPTKNRTSGVERVERADRADKAERVERLAAAGSGATRPTLTATAPVPIPSVAATVNPTRAAPSGPPAPTASRAMAPKTAASSSSVTAAVPAPATTSKKLEALPRPLAPQLSSGRSVTAVATPREPVASGAKGAVGSKPTASAAPATATGANKSKGRFLLQLSSFQDRAEADAFARRFAAQSAYVVATEIPGKGTWYRVRVGSYGSQQEASTAKTNFEREHNVIAYVAGTGPVK